MEAVLLQPNLFSHQWIPATLHILHMAAVGLLRLASGSRGCCVRKAQFETPSRYPTPVASGTQIRSAAARPRGAKSATGVLGLVLTRWRLASTDAGRNEALGLHELECRRLAARLSAFRENDVVTRDHLKNLLLSLRRLVLRASSPKSSATKRGSTTKHPAPARARRNCWTHNRFAPLHQSRWPELFSDADS